MSMLMNITVCVITIALLASFKLLIPMMIRMKESENNLETGVPGEKDDFYYGRYPR